MNNHYQLMNEARNVNKGSRTASIPSKRYNRSRVQAKRYNTSASVSTTSWDQAVDVETSYEDMEASFWS